MITRRDFARTSLAVPLLATFNPLKAAGNLDSSTSEGADIRRVGVRGNGAYWGAAGEQIDMLSGNLNFTFPILSAMSRGVKAKLSASCNSQFWQSSGEIIQTPGIDLGLGWRMLFGAVQPIGIGASAGYVHVEGTGAEYILVKSGNRWISRNGVYISYDDSAHKLYFPDGTVWNMDCISSSAESDSGTRYPTLIRDTNGNQIFVQYLAGKGSTIPNTSSRISAIQDARAQNLPAGRRTYSFLYSSDITPKLISIVNHIGSIEGFQFTYKPQSLSSPFANGTAQTATLLQSVQPLSGYSYVFIYNSFGELSSAKTLHGGTIGWNYQTEYFAEGRSIPSFHSALLRLEARTQISI